MYPACAIPEYAKYLFKFLWGSAARVPRVTVAIPNVRSIGRNTIPTESNAKAPNPNTLTRSTKPAAFEAIARNDVIGVGAPSYTSGAHA
jgi:hypothetical protein